MTAWCALPPTAAPGSPLKLLTAEAFGPFEVGPQARKLRARTPFGQLQLFVGQPRQSLAALEPIARPRQIGANLDAANVVRTNAEEAVLANSGVNLDEEAARLIRYQQSYQAVAQVVAVASTLFDTLLNATRR